MARLPTPGSDDGTWGTILNTYLSVSLNADGTLINGAEYAAKYTKPADGIPESDLSADVQSALAPDSTYLAVAGGTLTGDLQFPTSGFTVNDGTSLWQITINTSGTLISTKLN